MAVLLRGTSATVATNTSWTCNYPASIGVGEVVLCWIVGPTGKTVNTPSGWRLVYSADSGGCVGYLFTQVYASGASQVFTGSSMDIAYHMVSIRSSAPSGAVLGFGQQGYSGTAVDPVDAGDTYTYTADGKGDVDITTDTVFGVFQGGIMCDTDIPLYFYAGKAASAPTLSLGAEDSNPTTVRTLPTSSTVHSATITSSFKAGARGFTMSATGTTVGYGTWASENADTGGGGGPGGNGTVNSPPPTFTYLAKSSAEPKKSIRGQHGFMSSGTQQGATTHRTPGDPSVVDRGQDRAAIAPPWKDSIQPEQGSSITVV